MKSLYQAIVIATLSVGTSHSQTPPAVKVDVKPLKIQNIPSPKFQADNVPEKTWRPKEWLEVDLEFDVKVPQSEGGRRGSLDSMTVNYFIGLNHQTKDNKYEVLKGSFEYVSIPAAEKCHALAYVSPDTLRSILQKDNFAASSDIKAFGFEVMVNGTRVAGESSTGSAWWEKGDSFSFIDGAMLSKQQTPFSILWGDYDVKTKQK